jgi:osmotically-inducible protein OsmY
MKIINNKKRTSYPLPSRRALITLLAAIGLPASQILNLHAAEMKPELTDNSITSAVQAKLHSAKGMAADSIDVKTSDGMVTLSGSVNNLLSEARALQVAESVRGVAGVNNGITVTPVSRPDADIQKDIETALRQDPATESNQVTVAVQDAVATLSGSVVSRGDSQLAERIASGVKGLKKTQNNLTINYAATRTDAEIDADVKADLQWDIWVNGDAITATVKDGNVVLSGTAGSALAVSRATDDAWVDGVHTVDASRLKVVSAGDKTIKPGQTIGKTDDEIKQAVQAALHRDPRVKAFSPDVRVEDGVVILSGAVGNLKAKTSAQQDAKNTVGESWVDNLLVVRPNHAPSDAEIQTNLNAALNWDPLLGDSQIEAAVVNGIAYLSGGTEDSFERAEAGDVASRTQGVVELRNHLKVEPEYSVYDDDYYDWPYYDYNWPYYSDYNWPDNYGYVQTYGPSAPPSDVQIAKKISRSFFWSPFVHSADIKVTVDNGVAILSGTVGSWVGYDEAYQDARKSGATAVVYKKLKVEKGVWF